VFVVFDETFGLKHSPEKKFYRFRIFFSHRRKRFHKSITSLLVIQNFEIKDFFRKNWRVILFTIFLFWFVFALLILAEDAFALRLNGIKADPLDRIQYIIRWVLWALLTPLIIFLAIKFPIRRKNLIPGLCLHFLFALLSITLEFFIEVPLIRMITERATGTTPPLADYAAAFILKLNIYLLLYFIVAGTTYLLMYVESSNRSLLLAREAEIKSQRLQSQLSEARLRLLKMQLDPHFLFNTHHSIVSLILNDENDKAISMLTKLSDLLRLSLEDQQPLTSLEKEIQMLKLYLDIEQVRFEGRLKVSFEIESKTAQLKVPSFILQPLVENAIKHSVNVSSGDRTIRIHSSVDNLNLTLKVENDGSRVDESTYKEGIGIRNTKERLHQLYNGQSRFDLSNINSKGVAATITIPLN